MRRFPIIAAVVILGLCLAGCNKTTYWLKRCVGEGVDAVCIEARAETRRKFEEFEFVGNMETGELRLSGSKVSTDFSPLEHAAGRLMDRIDPAAALNPIPE